MFPHRRKHNPAASDFPDVRAPDTGESYRFFYETPETMDTTKPTVISYTNMSRQEKTATGYKHIYKAQSALESATNSCQADDSFTDIRRVEASLATISKAWEKLMRRSKWKYDNTFFRWLFNTRTQANFDAQVIEHLTTSAQVLEAAERTEQLSIEMDRFAAQLKRLCAPDGRLRPTNPDPPSSRGSTTSSSALPRSLPAGPTYAPYSTHPIVSSPSFSSSSSWGDRRQHSTLLSNPPYVPAPPFSLSSELFMANEPFADEDKSWTTRATLGVAQPIATNEIVPEADERSWATHATYGLYFIGENGGQAAQPPYGPNATYN
ncbi:hypothetical protein FISHEDRAFT_72092 [Fistulina hepatica ATCC 64428]|uniref:Uncharacterized protein n=1 Tax=Fistulina hepatica ATCC 64428 TaxID=1128425 RepID=A0A0D7AGS5_9AGAR|nr:hypothetical protein FISHEDRAFT_72092 [Fistulina hepatica ATCC 64428]